MSQPPVLAAGAVCWRVSKKGKPKILLVHRTQHKDVSLPKGKLDPGETLPETAVREIAEETGLIIALGAPLGVVEYQLPGGRDKQVYYWAAEVSPDAIANSTFASNDEIEELHWVGLEKARRVLSYPHDMDIVDRFAELFAQGRARTFAIVALRHGKAVPAEDWDGPDSTRPLMQRGTDQSLSVAHGVAAFRPKKLISSTAERCLRTIAPTARVTGLPVDEDPVISQDAYRSGGQAVREFVAKRIRKGESVVLCSHGPVLPQIIAAVAAETGGSGATRLQRAAALATAEYAVLHVPVDDPASGIVAVEVHGPTV
ncbi:NUDIX hydrolase [Protaetiibacter intestinalis]|uniref:NUDIX domain-containing protein n=1 Tax=Protaetiibacter intestinalis TaxID=2419774 RepID=A0A387B1Q1_9MICO|nr:NUDIX domain-containing protein [Protaetiibacter intestinalis]AYF97434.1 NUDIX domain-containing protein [Protaetiibacter intestinalis]